MTCNAFSHTTRLTGLDPRDKRNVDRVCGALCSYLLSSRIGLDTHVMTMNVRGVMMMNVRGVMMN